LAGSHSVGNGKKLDISPKKDRIRFWGENKKLRKEEKSNEKEQKESSNSDIVRSDQHDTAVTAIVR